MTDVDPDELGTVLNVFACPECGEDLRLEVREHIRHEYAVAICPDECFATSLRVGIQLEHDSEAATRSPAGYCVQCQSQIVDDADAAEVTLAGNGHLVHTWCEEAFREEFAPLGGESA